MELLYWLVYPFKIELYLFANLSHLYLLMKTQCIHCMAQLYLFLFALGIIYTVCD